jgi:hypothetical protein
LSEGLVRVGSALGPQPVEHYGKNPGPGYRVAPALLHRPRRADQHGLEFVHSDVRPDHPRPATAAPTSAVRRVGLPG